MRTLTTSLFAGGLSVLMGMTSFVPAQAITMPSISVGTQSDVLQVRNEKIVHRKTVHRQAVRRGNVHHYRYHANRYRGGRNRTGAILGGVAAGVIVGGVLAANSHQSCASRYRSYRASDNTYQPYSGPRRQCVLR